MNSLQPIKYAVSDQEKSALWQECEDMESFLRVLRSRGAWQIESIKAVRELADVSLQQAKETVHFSQTWADMRETSEALHESAFKALEIMQQEDETVAHQIAS